jgi:predicted nucleic acid-binding protein
MERIFVDTNIVLDFLLSRKPHFQDTAVLFSKADKKELKLSVSVLTITTAHYILSKRNSAWRRRAFGNLPFQPTPNFLKIANFLFTLNRPLYPR